MENELIYKQLIEKTFNSFYYVTFSEDEKNDIISETMSLCANEKSLAIFKSKLITVIYRHINQKLEQDPILIMDKYLTSMPENYEQSIDVLNNLHNLLKETLFTYEDTFLIDIINKNEKLHKALTIVFEKYKDLIVSGNVTKIFNNEFYISLIEIYAIVENIEIQIPEIKEIPFSQDPMSQYLREITAIPLLTPAEEKELIIKAKSGDEKSRKKFLESNLRLVVSIAKNYHNEFYPLLDIVQDGNIGLMKAFDKYDIEKGYRFSTYATWWIRQHIGRCIMNKSKLIRLPVHMSQQISKCNKITEEYMDKYGVKPDNEILSELTGITMERLELIQRCSQLPTSLNEIVGDKEDNQEAALFVVNDEIPIEDQIIEKDLRERVRALLEDSYLNEKEKQVLNLRFGLDTDEPLTLEGVGNIMNLTRERVRQIEKKALGKMRSSRKLNNYMNYVLSEKEAKKLFGTPQVRIPKSKIIQKNQDKLYMMFPNLTKAEYQKICDKLLARELLILFDDTHPEQQNIIEKVKELLLKRFPQRSIYSSFIGFNESEVDAAIEKLSEEEKETVRKTEVTYKERELINKVIIPKIQDILKDRDNIYDFFREYTKEQVDEAVTSLTIIDQKVINKFFSDVYMTPREESYFCYSIVPKIKRELKNIASYNPKSIEEYFPGYSIETINCEIALLEVEEVTLIDLYFNQKKRILPNENHKLKRVIIPKIRRRLEKISMARDIYDLFYKYPREIIDSTIEMLSSEDQNIILEFNEKGFTSEDNFYYINFVLVPNIEQMIIDSKKPKYATIYEMLPFFSKNIIDEQLKYFTEEEQELINKYFLHYGLITKEEKERFKEIINQLKINIRQFMNSSQIYKFLPEYTKETIDIALKGLDDESKRVIFKKVNNLETLSNEEEQFFENVAFPNFKMLCDEYGKSVKKRSIFEYFEGYDFDKLEEIIRLLPAVDRKLIYNRFNGKLTIQEKTKFYNYLIPKIKKIYSSLSQNSVHNYFLAMPDIIVDRQVNNLTNDERYLMHVKSILGQYTDKENDEEYQQIIQKLKNLCNLEFYRLIQNYKENNKVEMLYTFSEEFTEDDYTNLIELLKSNPLPNYLSLRASIIVAMKLGFLNGKCFSTKVVSEFYQISEKEVNKIVYEYLILRRKEDKVYVRTTNR